MSDAVNLALLVGRVGGPRHVGAWPEPPSGAAIGSRHGELAELPRAVARSLQAHLLTWSEVGVAPFLVTGLLTPGAYGVVASLMLIALVTNHRDKGFFITARPTEGWEYVGTLAVLALALGALGPGEWSLDNAWDVAFPFEPSQALATTASIGIGGTIVYLATFWRPRRPGGR